MTFKKENYTTTLQKAKMMVPGFREAFSRFEERLVLDQCSKSMLSNYGRNLAHLALHFGQVPHEVSVDEINSYLYPKEREELQQKALRYNREGKGDQVCFYLVKPD
jgi:hypothetical protein